ncbi:hypothetical protein K7X08_037544 [Anisodus acutangulus]|uniref:AB hydrolase-1 domain-containing protein n=1 Tax=Anisodus acutangulus TaxID=402998 RepID=A0A9Q1N0J8_9SOLA|nr:hypothetical protein K7X08_037544 [Anisodus acutangulus]
MDTTICKVISELNQPMTKSGTKEDGSLLKLKFQSSGSFFASAYEGKSVMELGARIAFFTDESAKKAGQLIEMAFIEENEEDKSDTGNEESELSTTLYKRRNVFREMWFCGNVSRRKVNENVRWSDCACEKCVSWMSKIGAELKLHVVNVIKEPDQANLQDFKGKKAENVVFLHGFISSSSLWTETIFPNLSEDANSAIDPFELNSFHIVAHSMGCVVALALAAKYSHKVKSITLIAPEPTFYGN